MPVIERLLPSSGPPSDTIARASTTRRARRWILMSRMLPPATGEMNVWRYGSRAAQRTDFVGPRQQRFPTSIRVTTAGMLAPFVARNGVVMLVGSSVRRVAIIGGTRIPFARSMGVYAEASNQEMLTASLKGLVDRIQPARRGARRCRRRRGAQALRGFQPDARERAR